MNSSALCPVNVTLNSTTLLIQYFGRTLSPFRKTIYLYSTHLTYWKLVHHESNTQGKEKMVGYRWSFLYPNVFKANQIKGNWKTVRYSGRFGGGGGGGDHLTLTWRGGAHFLKISTTRSGKNLHFDIMFWCDAQQSCCDVRNVYLGTGRPELAWWSWRHIFISYDKHCRAHCRWN